MFGYGYGNSQWLGQACHSVGPECVANQPIIDQQTLTGCLWLSRRRSDLVGASKHIRVHANECQYVKTWGRDALHSFDGSTYRMRGGGVCAAASADQRSQLYV